MEYLGSMNGVSDFEFPYSGNMTPRTPFFGNNNYNPQSQGMSSLNSLLNYQPQLQRNIFPNNSPIVLQVPDSISLDTILRQLGVDTCTIRPTPAFHTYYPPPAVELTLPPRSKHRESYICQEHSDSESGPCPQCGSRPTRRRRMVCRRASYSDSDDDDDDDDDRSSSRRRRRRRHGRRRSSSKSDRGSASNTHLHNLLTSMWQRMLQNSGNNPLAQGGQMPLPIGPAQMLAGNNRPGFPNTPGAIPQESNPPNQKSSGVIASLFGKSSKDSGSVVQAPMNLEPAQYAAANNTQGMMPPSGGGQVRNVWGTMTGASGGMGGDPTAPPATSGGGQVRNLWGAMTGASGGTNNFNNPQPTQGGSVQNVWGIMSRPS